MGTEYEVYAELAAEGVGLFGGADAAGQGNLFDAALSFKAVELAEVAADAVYGVLAHVAGVEDDDVGVLIGGDFGVAGVQDHAPHPIGVVDVHLAAEGPYAGGLAGARPARGGGARRAGPGCAPRGLLRPAVVPGPGLPGAAGPAGRGLEASGTGAGARGVSLILFLRLVDPGPHGALPGPGLALPPFVLHG